MARFRKQQLWLITFCLTFPLWVNAQSTPLTTFAPNTVISSSAVNGNFANIFSRVATLEGNVAPGFTSIVFTDLAVADGNFAPECLAALQAQTAVANGAQLVPIGCTLAANRKCGTLGYKFGVFVGESSNGGVTRNAVCVK